MKRMINLKAACSIFLLGVLSLSIGCGKGNDQPNPLPPPAPQGPVQPNPAYPYNGANCPTVSGNFPLNQSNTPFYGSLQSLGFGGSNANSLTLSFSLQQYADFTRPTQNIVASGAFNFSDLQYLSPTPTNTPTNVCLTSGAINNFSATVGTYNSYDHSVSVVLRGQVQYQYNPINPYTGQPGYGNTSPQNGTDIVEVDIGYSCQAFLADGRIYGCVDVKIGSTARPPLQYRSR